MEQIEYLLVISEEKSLSRAAEKLYISQPALTKFIQKIEREYHVKILKRNHNSVELTPEGQLFLREKLKMASIEKNLRYELDILQSKRSSIVIGSGWSRTHNFLPEVTEIFIRNHTDIDVKVISHGELDLLKRLRRGECDLAYGILGDISDPNIESIYIAPESIGLAIPISMGIIPEDIDPRSTIRHPYILEPHMLNGTILIQSDSSNGAYLSYSALMTQYHINHKQVITSNNPEFMNYMIRKGVGYGISYFAPDGSNYFDKNGNLFVYRCILPGMSIQRMATAVYLKDNPKAIYLKEYAELIRQYGAKL